MWGINRTLLAPSETLKCFSSHSCKQMPLHMTSVISLNTSILLMTSVIRLQKIELQQPLSQLSNKRNAREPLYKNSSLRATTLPVKFTQPRNEFKFLPKVRASVLFRKKQPFINCLYLLVSKAQKLDEGHSGFTIVALAFCRLR